MTTATFVGVLAGLGLLEASGLAWCWAIYRTGARQPLPSDDDALRNHQP